MTDRDKRCREPMCHAYNHYETSYTKDCESVRRLNVAPDTESPNLINWIENTGVRPHFGLGKSILVLYDNLNIGLSKSAYNFVWNLYPNDSRSFILAYAIIKPPVIINNWVCKSI